MEKTKIAVVGGGISGLSIAQCLKTKYDVRVFEKEEHPGGLIKCSTVNGNLYHMVGGHVFNSRRKDVLEWFWSFFNRDKEFTKIDRNAVISMESGRVVRYPIENYVYMMEEHIIKAVIDDIISIIRVGDVSVDNFEDFLKHRFGNTLYEQYFKPYNEKVWRKDLKTISLEWLEGKLPMPTLEEILFNNMNHVTEMNMVHSSFYYPKKNGSQFLADRLSEDLNIEYNSEVFKVGRISEKWNVNGFICDKVIFCGNVKNIISIFSSLNLIEFQSEINGLEYHGTTSVLCEVDQNPYSWVYLPSKSHESHRIICTGNFAISNNGGKNKTATVEFTDYISKEDILKNLTYIPFLPKYLEHKYTELTYPIQNKNTRILINSLKSYLENHNVFLLGRFAEWEYYNMDAAMGAAIDLSKKI